MSRLSVGEGYARKSRRPAAVLSAVTGLAITLAGCEGALQSNAGSQKTASISEAKPLPACHLIRKLDSILLLTAQIESALPPDTSIPSGWVDTLTRQHTVKPVGILTEIPRAAEQDKYELNRYEQITYKIAHAMDVSFIELRVDPNLPPGSIDVISGYDTGRPCPMGPPTSPSNQSV